MGNILFKIHRKVIFRNPLIIVVRDMFGKTPKTLNAVVRSERQTARCSGNHHRGFQRTGLSFSLAHDYLSLKPAQTFTELRLSNLISFLIFFRNPYWP